MYEEYEKLGDELWDKHLAPNWPETPDTFMKIKFTKDTEARKEIMEICKKHNLRMTIDNENYWHLIPK